MEYTVQKLGKLAGISTRTLRYYDEIGLLKPARVNSSGYRIYGKQEVSRLQQILFYRELSVPLEAIRDILTSPSFDGALALREHRAQLLSKREQLDTLIANVEKTIAETEGRILMTDQEKFEGFKQRLIDENEAKYGEEIREKYGTEQVERSNNAFKSMTKEQYGAFETLGSEIMQKLKAAFATGDAGGALAQEAADLHRQWLTTAWGGGYSKEAHAGIVRMYVEDERFTAYYDQEQPGLAKFLRDAVLLYTGMNG